MRKLLPFFSLYILICFSSIIGQNKTQNFAKVDSVIENAIKDHAFPGAQVLIWENGKTLLNKSYGHFNYDDTSLKVTKNTLYDLASLTKVIATTTAAMICYDRKLFSLDDAVIKYIPEFGVNGKEKITLLNLLLHNSGLPAWKKFYETDSNSEEVINDIYSSSLEYETGTKTVYSDLGIITLGKIIEKVTGKSLDVFCKKEIFKPLKMSSTFFNPPDSIKEFCAPTEIDNYWRKRLLQGEVHDETAAMLNGVAGHAGLFSNATDIAKLISVLINKGQLNGKQFIKESTVKLFTKRYSDESTRALGWDTRSESGSSSGDYFSDNSYGHTGFTGTSVWVDPQRNLFVILLTNRVYPTRENNKILKVRPELHNAVIKSLE
jgi:CubicO group peptidase (beta-lactamase class C family)